jgi:glycosyltransferase involved in cell wall biosynthesis
MPSEPSVSVVVPVRNGGRALAGLISALEAQTLARERFEVIVADDGSTDGATEGIATPDGWARVAAGPPRNSYAARNRGARLATAPILAFCDADCRPAPMWLEAGLNALAQADVVAGRIRFEPVPRVTVWALLDIDGYLDQEHLVRSGLLSTANVLVRRAVFEELDGFDASLPSGGDGDFARRCHAAGHRIAYAPDVVVSHPPRATAAAYLGKEWRIHHAGAQREARSGDGPEPTAGPRGGWLAHLSVAGRVRARRAAGLSFRLNRARLAEAGVQPSLARELAALSVRYGFMYYFHLLARRRGRAHAGRR